MRIWMIVGGAALVGAAVLVGVREQKRSKELAALGEQVRALADRTGAVSPSAVTNNGVDSAALGYRVALAAAARQAELASAAPAPAARSPEAPDPRSGGPERGTTRGMTEEEMRTHLEVAVARGRPDPGWTRSLSQDLSAHLRAHAGVSDSRVRDVECKEDICRVEMGHASRADYERFMGGAVLDPSAPVWSTPSFTTLGDTASDGSVTAVSFVAKRNEILPLDE
jgi:hypothetical protein